MPRHQWGFRLSLNNAWIGSYVSHQHGPDLTMFDDSDDDQPSYLWSSSHFDEFVWVPFPAAGTMEERASASLNHDRTLRALWNRATALKMLFDGAWYIQREGHYHPMSWSGLFHLPDGRERTWEPGNPDADPFDRKVIGKSPFSQTAYEDISGYPDHCIYVARYDRITLDLLRIIGRHGPTFVSLSNMIDTMTGSKKWSVWSTEDIAQAAELEGVNADTIGRIIATANNFAVSGTQSRHGNLTPKAYTDPIPLAQATQIILRAAHRFIQWRATLSAAGKTSP